jgi:purine-nucleoside phosphorylase
MINMSAKYRETVEVVEKQIPFQPEICIVLGSGLGDFAEKVETVNSIATSSLPNYPISTVQGHSGFLHFSNYANKKLLIVQGRIHFYEGYEISQCVVPVHVAAKLGCKKIILTNAAGGVNTNYTPGDLMLNTSFLGTNIKKELTELIGLGSIENRNTFLDFPSKEMIQKIRKAALDEKILLREGVYWFNKGPAYETPAEIQMSAKFGADAVGMSTVHEAFYASILGLKVAAISCVTNFAAGLTDQKLSHIEVMETAERVKTNFERLVKKSIELL